MVDVPSPEEPPKRKRGRPPGTKNKPKEKGPGAGDFQENVTSLVKGTSDLLALAAGSHWAYSQEEAALVGAPLSRILARYLSVEALEKYSDAVALTLALALTAGPRLALTLQTRKERKEKSGNESAPGREAGTAPASNRQSSRKVGTIQSILPGIEDAGSIPA